MYMLSSSPPNVFKRIDELIIHTMNNIHMSRYFAQSMTSTMLGNVLTSLCFCGNLIQLTNIVKNMPMMKAPLMFHIKRMAASIMQSVIAQTLSKCELPIDGQQLSQ